MFAYTVRRIFAGAILLVIMSMVTYVLFFASSEQPERFACGPKCTQAQLETTKKSLGYDEPVYVQWGKFAKGVVTGREFPDDPALKKSAPDLITECPAPCIGYSQGYNTPVLDKIKDALPISVSLAIVAFIMWMSGGIIFGVSAALMKGTIIDRGIVALSLVAFAFPTFFIGLLLLQFVAIPQGWPDIPRYTPLTENPWAWFTGLLMPSFVLALVYMAGYIRMTRAFVLETMSEDYIRTARAKGLPKRKVIGKHTLRATLTPLVTLSGLDLAGLLGGALITETVFNFNGVGRLAIRSIQRFDLPIIVGIVLLVAAFVIVANIVVDLLYAVIDPRVRLG